MLKKKLLSLSIALLLVAIVSVADWRIVYDFELDAFRLDYFESNIIHPFSDATDITAAGGIDVTKRVMVVQGSGGPVTITATPSITNSISSNRLTIIGNSDANTVTLQDEGNLSNSGLALDGGNNFTLGLGDTLELIYISSISKWVEISRSDN